MIPDCRLQRIFVSIRDIIAIEFVSYDNFRLRPYAFTIISIVFSTVRVNPKEVYSEAFQFAVKSSSDTKTGVTISLRKLLMNHKYAGFLMDYIS